MPCRRREYPCRILATSAVWVQLDSTVAAAFAGGASSSLLFRRAGVGRVRKDLSTPPEAPADRIWIQGLDDKAVLVIRREPGPEHAAFFRLGAPSSGVRGLGRTFGRLAVQFVLADDFLPDASFRHLHRMVEQRRAFGALVSCTTDG